jgi:sarcosine oxidase subunit alpha
MTGWRVPKGGRIDRTRPLRFQWEGRNYSGFAGDTLASALLANGVSVIGRSFKYHRPRGLLAAGLEEPNAIIQLEHGAHAVPNIKATQIELYDGLNAGPVNAWPGTRLDLLAVNGLAKRFIPAAFYYKTFLWPSWHWFEPAIRKAAGLGTAPTLPDPDTYEHRFAHAETLVIGAGAAGIMAALAAAERGEQVVLVETDADLGGGVLATYGKIEGQSPEAWLASMLARISADPGITVLRRTMAFGFYDHGLVGLIERLTDHLTPSLRSGPRQRLWKVRADRVVLATGAFERPLAFANNDLPGIMLASAAQTYLLRWGVACGRRVVVATTNDSAYSAAFALHEAGVAVAAILDSRANSPCMAEASARGITVMRGTAPRKASGGRGLKSVTYGPVAGGGPAMTLACDALLVSGGWNPAVHLHSQSGGGLAFDDGMQAFLPGVSVQSATNVGAAAGVFDIEAAIAGARGEASSEPSRGAMGPTLDYADGDPEAAKAWLDFQNDVTVGDVQLAARENFRSVEHVKRYTTLGMASDQGKTSNVAGIRVMAGLLDKAPEAIGTTKFRPPFDPVTIGAFAGSMVGANLMPVAYPASHRAQVALGAKIEHYGHWERAAYFPRAGEDEQAAVAREVRTVRNAAGLFDASPLGKIEVKGPDAATFLDRMYVNGILNLGLGRCRYGLMLSEHGIVYDDGIVARMADDHFLVGTTSGHAAAIAEGFEEWLQCEWTSLRVLVSDVTTAWAVMNVAGPRARDVLAAVGTGIDLAPAAFPHMSLRMGHVGGIPARVQRVSFTGELSYEIAVPWGHGAALWNALIAAGEPHGITPFGVEALMVMRVEKGFLHVGSDTDGTTLPQDIGFGGIAAKKVSDFVGRRSTQRPDGLRTDRRQLVGLEVTDGRGMLNAGAHVLTAGATEARGTEGWVTSSVHSPTLGRPLAMALVKRGHSRMGEPVRIWDLGVWRVARIVDQRFFDPLGERLDG